MYCKSSNSSNNNNINNKSNRNIQYSVTCLLYGLCGASEHDRTLVPVQRIVAELHRAGNHQLELLEPKGGAVVTNHD